MSFTRRKFLLASSLVAGGAAFHTRLFPAVHAIQSTPAYGDWGWVRSQFPLTHEYRHFATFYLTTHPQPVREAIESLTKAMDANPSMVVEHGMFKSVEENMQQRVYEAAAKYTGGKPDEFALVPNTTTGLALIYNGLPLKKGDEILTTTHDHYSQHESIRLAAERTGAKWRKITLFEKSAETFVTQIVESVRAAIKPRTRVLGVTWVHSSTGVKLPIRAIADALAEVNKNRKPEERVLLIVDGVHGLGAVDESVAAMGCDFFVSGTHKWMFAPRGTGIIWARGENWAKVKPTVPTFSNFEPFSAWMENRKPNGTTQASWVTPGGFFAYEYQWAMVAAFHFHEQIGRQRIATRINELNGRLKDGLAEIPGITLHTPRSPALSAGIVCFEVKGLKPEEVVHRLLERKIIASTTPYGVSYARLAAGIMNTPEEVDEVLAAVRTLV